MKTCSKCNGTGIVKINPGGGFGFNPGNRMITVKCTRCDGLGKV